MDNRKIHFSNIFFKIFSVLIGLLIIYVIVILFFVERKLDGVGNIVVGFFVFLGSICCILVLTYRIEVYDNYLEYKYLKLTLNKIPYANIDYVQKIWMFINLFVIHYHVNKHRRTAVLLPLQKGTEFIREMKARYPDLHVEERLLQKK